MMIQIGDLVRVKLSAREIQTAIDRKSNHEIGWNPTMDGLCGFIGQVIEKIDYYDTEYFSVSFLHYGTILRTPFEERSTPQYPQCVEEFYDYLEIHQQEHWADRTIERNEWYLYEQTLIKIK